MGSANTPANIMKIYQQLNLSMCSINTVEIPKSCTSYVFWNVFEHCLKIYNMVVLGVYKRHDDSNVPLGEELFGTDSSRQKAKPEGASGSAQNQAGARGAGSAGGSGAAGAGSSGIHGG